MSAYPGANPKTFIVSAWPEAEAWRIIAPTGSPRANGGVLLKADRSNQQSLFIGEITMDSASGYELTPGDSIYIEVDDPSRLYGYTPDASGQTDILYVLYV